jgi:SOS-response transcriptional repressor LexA
MGAVDDKWFKQQQKLAGVTAEDIAQRMGRVRSTISHLYSGRQKMSLEWAKVFAETLNQPLDEVLRRAGVADETITQTFQPGFSESDAVLFRGRETDDRRVTTLAQAFGERPGVDVWQVKSQALSLMGYMPGDFLLVDTHAAERVRQGDVVVAQIYDNAKGTASTALRRYEPPVLVAASPDPDDSRVYVVDGNNVVIRGRVVASWRS